MSWWGGGGSAKSEPSDDEFCEFLRQHDTNAEWRRPADGRNNTSAIERVSSRRWPQFDMVRFGQLEAISSRLCWSDRLVAHHHHHQETRRLVLAAKAIGKRHPTWTNARVGNATFSCSARLVNSTTNQADGARTHARRFNLLVYTQQHG